MRLTSRVGGGALLWLVALVVPQQAAGQVVDSVTVRIRQVAGDNLYLDIGSRQGLQAGDTIPVSRPDGGAALGRVFVVGTSDDRSVLAFAGEPFPAEGGDRVTLGLLRPPEIVEVEEDGRDNTPALAERAPPPVDVIASSARRAPYGRMAAEVTGLHSTTTVGGADAIDIGRAFATPAFRLDLTVPDLFAGFQLRTNVRFAYRYSQDDAISPPTSTRIYDAVLERGFSTVPLELRIGRFRSLAESYSGYTDGLFVRYGGPALGVGFIAGFEPDLWNETPSVDRPKASVFVDGERRGEGWWWDGDLSAHLVMGAASERDRRSVGLSQRVGVGRFLLSEDLQLEQDPEAGDVSLSYLRLQGSLQVARGLSLRGGYTSRKVFREPVALDVFGPQSDRLLAGVGFSSRSGGFGFDVSTTARDGASSGTGYQGYLDLTNVGVASLGARVGASYWTGDEGNSLSVSPTLTRAWRNAYLSLGYRLYRSEYLSRQATQHGMDATLDFPLGRDYRASVLLRAGLSEILRSEEFRIQLSRNF